MIDIDANFHELPLEERDALVEYLRDFLGDALKKAAPYSDDKKPVVATFYGHSADEVVRWAVYRNISIFNEEG